MNRTEARLADGREIFFYDDAPRQRTVKDTRDIGRPGGGSELRYDPFLAEWVAVAAGRQNRTHLPSTAQCPLCPSTDERATEVPQQAYDVVVFENRFPSFSEGEALQADFADKALRPVAHGGRDLTQIRHPSTGRCEVVCFASAHTTSLARQSPVRMRTVVDAWADRTEALLGSDQVDQVYCFENRGEEIGVTLHHPHGQIYGYPFPAPRTRRMLDSALQYRERSGRDLFADAIEAEHAQHRRHENGRIIASTEYWTAFVPAWARWPVEVHIYPHRPVRALPELQAAERDDFAELYLDILKRGDQLFRTPLPYISGWQQASVSASGTDFRLHLC